MDINLITNNQQSSCNSLFELGFDFSRITKEGLYVTKRTQLGLVSVLIEDSGLVNGDNVEDWIRAFSNDYQMRPPSPLSFTNVLVKYPEGRKRRI